MTTTVGQHVHGEAFRLMRYGTKDGRIELRIWNSRDGVTPFGCTHPDFPGVELTHLPPWSADVYAPTYVPDVGEWVWIDLHPERAMQLAMQKVEHFWDHPDYPLRERCDTKDEAARMFVDSFLYTRHPETGEKVPSQSPDLVQVTEPLREQFAREAAERRPRRPVSDRPQA